MQKRNLLDFQIPVVRYSQQAVDNILTTQSITLHHIKSKFSGYQANQYVDYKNPITKFLDLNVNNIGDPFSTGTYNLNTKPIQISVLDYYADFFGVTPRNTEIDASQDPQSYWGYVLSMGSSQGNLMAFWMARDYIQGKYLIVNKLEGNSNQKSRKISKNTGGKKNMKQIRCHISKTCKKNYLLGDLLQPIYFSSDATHYSCVKSAVIMAVRSFSQIGNQIYPDAQISYTNSDGEIIYVKKNYEPFPQYVPVYNDFDGRIDPYKLTALVDFFAKKRHGIIIILNYGTTFTGAFDEIQVISQKLEPIFKQNGLDEITREIPDPNEVGKYIQDTRRGYWIHVDGALGNGYLKYLHNSYKNSNDEVDEVEGKKYLRSDIPLVDFDNNRLICSTVLSGHKFPGAPWPCGIFMTRHKYQLYPPSAPMYIGSMDSTLSGSRNGLSPIVLWYYLSTHSDQYINNLSYECFKLAKQIQEKIEKIMTDKKQQRKRQILQDPTLPQLNLVVSRAPFSISLVFSQVSNELRQKYTLALQQLAVNSNTTKKYNHYFVMEYLYKNPKVVNQFLEDLSHPNSFMEEIKHITEKSELKHKNKNKSKLSLGQAD